MGVVVFLMGSLGPNVHGLVCTWQVVTVVDAALAGNVTGLKAWHAMREAFKDGRPLNVHEFEAFSESLEDLVCDPMGGLIVRNLGHT
jgi:hypothetical protein